jgi:GNAT superfamily N-acetyltransferase
MLVRRLTEDDLEPLWQMRLQALTNNPEAFGSTYEEVVARGSGWLLERLRQNWQETFYLGAFDGSLIGIVGFFREEASKERHKGGVVSMYVLPERRGQGAGRLLMQEIIAQVKQLEGLEQLHLAVVTTNPTAHRLYHSLGFETYGIAPRTLKIGDLYWDEELMILYLQ